MNAFKVGGNVPPRPAGDLQNQLMQLIQYAPLTAEVHEMPLLIVPPWINKFCILDLKPRTRSSEWATEAGYGVRHLWVNLTRSSRAGGRGLRSWPAGRLGRSSRRPASAKAGHRLCIGGT